MGGCYDKQLINFASTLFVWRELYLSIEPSEICFYSFSLTDCILRLVALKSIRLHPFCLHIYTTWWWQSSDALNGLVEVKSRCVVWWVGLKGGGWERLALLLMKLGGAVGFYCPGYVRCEENTEPACLDVQVLKTSSHCGSLWCICKKVLVDHALQQWVGAAGAGGGLIVRVRWYVRPSLWTDG